MSKIGRKPISLGDVKVEIKGQDIHYSGKNNSGTYVLPDQLDSFVEDGLLYLKPKDNLASSVLRTVNRVWGLHRALLANVLKGASQDFEKEIEIQGLGYKAILSGHQLTFSLGYSHKIDFEIPSGVSVVVNKSGQKLVFKSSDKALLGHVCSQVRSLRKPEPYKGTGIRYAKEIVRRKAGKTKSTG